ncbi:type-1 angiotensin II receptor B-like [Paramacrobiotus metropolitanus]|uniref:type-1 angiotensin II receptor B-like n=1 Tax=Paramacrobiotus metropolitanus TaxID=2943436 RepID=UPI00244598CB|nr:type-1 angiotensin II receptor B-like [Paramacrobiotus metropolitanus]
MNNSTLTELEFNRTEAAHDPVNGRAMLTVYIIILTLTVVTNATALIILYRTKSSGYSAAFGIYLIHLFTMNILSNLLDIPLDIAEKVYSVRFTAAHCALYTYVNWALMAVLVYSHLAITLNRLWAVLHPHSYRQRHTLQLAVGICCLIWIVVHLCAVPLFAYRLTHQSENDVCLLDMTDYSSDLSVPVQIWETKVVADPRTFRMLLALTVSLLCAWMPQLIWSILEDWIILDFVTMATVDLVLDCTWTAQALLDPIMFIAVF